MISRDKFGYTEEEVNTFVEAIISFSDVVNPDIKIDAIKADPDDNKILECAVTSGASYIVSGDKHLLFKKTLSWLSFEKAAKGYKKMRNAEWNRVFTIQIDTNRPTWKRQHMIKDE